MMIVAFATCPPTGVILDLFDEVTSQLASTTSVEALVNEPIVLPSVDGRHQVTYRRPFGLLTPTGARALNALRKSRPDHLLVWTQHPLAFIPMIAFRRANRIAWWHEPANRGQVGRVKGLAYKAYELLVIRLADVVLVASPAIEASVPSRYRAKTRVVQFPSLPGFDEPSDRFADAPTDFVFFGVLAPHKGLDVLAEALELLRRDGMVPTVRIAGPGDLSEAAPRLADYAQRHPQQIDVVEGFIPSADLASAITSSGGVVLPYLSAAGSTTTGISHRLGRPVLASNVGSFADEITQGVNGWLVAASNAGELAAAMRHAAETPLAPASPPTFSDSPWVESFMSAIRSEDRR